MDGVIGTVMVCGFNFPPRMWSLCSGQLITIASNSALFSLVGTFYGGDGRTTFGLPNLNGRVPVGQGQAPGSPLHWTMGEAGGFDYQTMTLAEMPSHSHAAVVSFNGTPSANIQASTGLAESETPRAGDYLAQVVPGPAPSDKAEKIYSASLTDEVSMAPAAIHGLDAQVTIGNSGAGSPFSVVQPSLGINYSICVQGTYPSRN